MTTTRNETSPRPFTLEVPQADLDDLRDRLARTRHPHVRGDGSDEVGVGSQAMRDLVQHWLERYDWRAHERELNTLHHVVAEVGGRRVHAVHERGDGDADAVTLVLLHGWPDSFLRYRHVVPRLVEAGHDVVVPSLPGFGFSEPGPTASPEAYAEVVRGLLDVLGVEQYVVHGGDWGSATAEALALADPDRVRGLHLSDVPFHHQFAVDADGDAMSEAEQAFLRRGAAFAEQAAYISVQSTQPTTIAHAFADSPVGQAAWVWEKYGAWSDRQPDAEEVLTQVCLTWFTGTEHSSMLVYADMGGWEDDDGGEASWSDGDPSTWESPRPSAPTGFAIFPADIGVPPREYAERFFDVTRYTLMPRGGHFGALEEPEAFSAELVAFAASLT